MKKPASPRTFVLTFVATVLLGALAMASLSVYLNPWGNYGRLGYFHLYNARMGKTELIDSLPPERRPQVVIIGSSNVMNYSPATIQRLLGRSAFCYGVFWGKSEDMLCISRHLVLDLDHRPELLILGIDTWSFKPARNEHPVFPGVRRRLLNTPELVRHHPDVDRLRLGWSKFIDAFSRQQVIAGLRSLRRPGSTRVVNSPLAESGFFKEDGTRMSYLDAYGGGGEIFESVERGEYPITAHLSALVEEGRLRELSHFNTYDFDSFYEPRVRYLELLLELCDREDVEVVFVINPVHPIFWEVLAKNTAQLANLERLRVLLARFESEHSSVVGTVDASHIENFGGDPLGFFDEIHPATRNCDLILERVAALLTR